jgi:hypothetical protein
MKGNTWYEKIQNIDRKTIYAVVFIVFILPLLRPVGLPLSISDSTAAAYQLISDLDQGGIVWHSIGFNAGSDAEPWPQMIALTKHYMSKGLKIIYFPTMDQGGMYANRIVDTLAKEYGYQYGEDIIVLPFMAGGESVIAGLKNFHSVFSHDAYGHPISSLPMMQSFRGMEDVAVLVANTGGNDIQYYVSHIEPAFKVKIVAAGTSAVLPVISPYVASGQVKGVINGIAGAAEYEKISGFHGQALGAMDAQSMGHLLILVLIFLGNLGFWVQKRYGKAGVK